MRSIALWLGNLHTVSPTERNVSHTGLWNSLMRAESSLRGKMAGYAKNEQARIKTGSMQGHVSDTNRVKRLSECPQQLTCGVRAQAWEKCIDMERETG